MRQKTFDGTSWNSPHPTLSSKFFRYPKLMKDWSVPYGIFRHCETKNFRRKKFVTPPFLSINFFVTRNFLKHSIEAFFYERFRHCETKNCRRKIFLLPPPPILSLNFFATRNFPKHSTEGFFYETFRYRETKKLSTEIRAITLWSMNVSDTRNYWKTKGFTYEISRHFETKNFRRKNLYTPPSPLSYP